ncbi:UDP-N-acetylglucosamine--N-acetylmuramyl-(pentapeptide) pyrophosphoryl-undecaprenol N-acetylglucosamine transferase MurG [Cupriavidus necator N-1]|jgi:UDP-N-acetylglucosamine--N-acetylmuramyl-(pentapeptide) pyrophosphoryl-undecaprenol N-acetylglucosamine transferase|uniref:UDP-N-acetylglucosamine--N-acetylmuramyl-(pentapeptide) pyrophosphoryl-undecaprenol N-acetylglucosamine transferase n=1 Tax=Cupriavidus necator (strain ATCC 43291 / DSM 13513 / CCUG 52238 / LMG 8453 / N-1) TaxID=1042878 RepID=G0EX86_CUPNN|nr:MULTISPECIES: undecaprenyldiphospho-muramoylpentapeptide beta-N-acetylglucosaminyltransferase [Cupriavidus]AEI78521.1 UDP-N-acetylglucosamine--N-acetylmuramyl-(pentapeptide) pyrophosphoryl-undecaprenol N-acetylglucosamine transferase MurG [Cupriavidus necator N-1]KAI3599009.1 UDP-N-acetylglucosamine--N-acetylmuramyl- (pentapeptide) pyrophosphoryl-undecaprenol N-acetylglucosamine transferase [Cupriavidus necator H850]MDX6012955.1 undecaprenyldiphospho-muramoylpentapeptide beta-N-acetylglucosam
MTAPRTLLVMAGGTGGHVFPGLAVAHALREQGWKVVWLGNRTGMEATLVPKHDIPMEFIQFGGLRGKGLVTKFLLPLNLLRAFWQSIVALRRVRPSVVLGMGGYITFPAGMMASLLGRPLVLHEQNSIAGLANKVLAKVADRVLCAFPDTLPGGEWTGNPVREELAHLDAPEARYDQRSGPLRILVVGGSLGAAALNEVVPKAIALLPEGKRPVVTHQAGAKQIDTLRANYAAAQVPAQTLPFIDDMARAYADADLVICRAGAMTVSEVAAAGVAAMFVPFPHAVDDHQTTNAEFLSKQGAALLVQQKDLTAEGLAQTIASLTRPQLKDMARLARGLAKPEATRRVAEICSQLARD